MMHIFINNLLLYLSHVICKTDVFYFAKSTFPRSYSFPSHLIEDALRDVSTCIISRSTCRWGQVVRIRQLMPALSPARKGDSEAQEEGHL